MRPVEHIFGKRIAEARRARYMTQEDLAAKAGYKVKNIQRIEAQEIAGIDRAAVPDFAAALDMPVEKFVRDFLAPADASAAVEEAAQWLRDFAAADPGQRAGIVEASGLKAATLESLAQFFAAAGHRSGRMVLDPKKISAGKKLRPLAAKKAK